MEPDQRLCYLGKIPHAQRSVLLLSAAMVALHPSGNGVVQEIRRHHPDLDGQQLCIQVLLDLMVSISGSWNAGTTVLLPVAVLIEQAVSRATEDVVNAGSTSPLSLAEQIWALIEQLHHEQEALGAVSATQPSSN